MKKLFWIIVLLLLACDNADLVAPTDGVGLIAPGPAEVSQGEHISFTITIINYALQDVVLGFNTSCQIYWTISPRGGDPLDRFTPCNQVLTSMELKSRVPVSRPMAIPTRTPIWPYPNGELPKGVWTVTVGLVGHDDEIPPRQFDVRIR